MQARRACAMGTQIRRTTDAIAPTSRRPRTCSGDQSRHWCGTDPRDEHGDDVGERPSPHSPSLTLSQMRAGVLSNMGACAARCSAETTRSPCPGREWRPASVTAAACRDGDVAAKAVWRAPLRIAYFLAVVLVLSATSAAAADVAEVNPQPGARLPLALRFQDETGRAMTLGQALDGHPTVLVFADWTCNALCGTTL